MEQSWKARKMIPGKDTISVISLHYGLRPNLVLNIIKESGAEVIREDGYQGTLRMVSSREAHRKVMGWMDGTPGVDLDTTKLTRRAIMTIAQWKWQHRAVNEAA